MCVDLGSSLAKCFFVFVFLWKLLLLSYSNSFYYELLECAPTTHERPFKTTFIAWLFIILTNHHLDLLTLSLINSIVNHFITDNIQLWKHFKVQLPLPMVVRTLSSKVTLFIRHYLERTEWLMERLAGRFRKRTAALPAEPYPASACLRRKCWDATLKWCLFTQPIRWVSLLQLLFLKVWCQSLHFYLHWKIPEKPFFFLFWINHSMFADLNLLTSHSLLI